MFGGNKNQLVDEDHGYEELMDKLEELYQKPSEFYIGVFETDLEQAIKAGVHEFGAPAKNIPPRKWLSSFFDEHSEDLAEIYLEACSYWLEVGGSKTEVFSTFSEEALILLRGYLETNPLTPDLKPATWATKQSDTMLVETAEMLSAIAIRYSGTKDKAKGKSAMGKLRSLRKYFG